MAARSRISELVAFLNSIKGDLTNITSPPSFLAPESVVEISTCWAERPSLYVSAAREPDPQRRALLVLKWFLACHRRQFYVGANVTSGIKKPLNAFLGEVFFGQWTDDTTTVKSVTEQVSHHPPITACYMADDKFKVSGDGYSRVEMTFSGSLNINQTGHSMFRLDGFNERFLIPFPSFKIKGFFSGHLYPEIYGTHFIVSSSGFISEITYSGKGLFYGMKNHVEAKMYRRDDENKTPLYQISGCWSDRFSIYDGATGEIIDEWVPESYPPSILEEPTPVDKQDVWESRRAWKDVISAIKAGDLSLAVTAKTKVEEAQRAIRKANPNYISKWEPLFFTALHTDQPEFEDLASAIPGLKIHADKTKGVWRFDRKKAESASKPYHGGNSPIGLVTSNDATL